MNLIIEHTLEAWVEAATQVVAEQIRRKPHSVLGLATGDTTSHLHRALVQLAQNGEVDFSQVVAFQVDEYAGLARENPASCYARMEEQLFKHVPLRKEHIHFPEAQWDSLESACDRYEALIHQYGGIDLQVLGIGHNGHIGFNEPGTPFESHTHVAAIASHTVNAKAGLFGSANNVPRWGITIGIKTIMEARAVLLMANGGTKAEIIQKALQGPVTPEVPASVLQLHPNLWVVLDREAGGGLAQS